MATRLAIDGGRKTVPASMKQPWPPVTAGDIRAVARVLRRGVLWGPMEREVLGLQREFAAYVGARHALVVNSGTAALHACVAAVGIGPGDEVLTPAYSFWATSQAVLAHNGIPIFVDIDPDTMNMDPRRIAERITPRTRALLPVHVHGLCADMDAINRLARRHGLAVIEDAAQAAGARYRGRSAGVLGDLAGFSLNGSKNLPAGEGGVVTTNDAALMDRARKMAMFGERAVPRGAIRLYDAEIMGFNYRNHEMADAFCRSVLRRFDALQAARARNCEYLCRELGRIEGVRPPEVPPGYVHAWHLYKVRLYPERLGITRLHPKRFRWAVQRALFEEGVPTFEWHNMPVPAQKVFLRRTVYPRGCPWNCRHVRPAARRMRYDPMDYPVTVDMFDRSFCINHIFPPNGRPLMEAIVAAFHKVFGNLDAVLKHAGALEVPRMPGDTRRV